MQVPPEYAKIPLKSGLPSIRSAKSFTSDRPNDPPPECRARYACAAPGTPRIFPRRSDQPLENGAPKWGRIVLAGQSQGAGMAAFIAKRQAAARVILFSSPWDFVVSDGNARRLAPGSRRPAKRRQSGGSADISSRNPFHGEGIRNPAYAEQRAFFSWPIAVAAAL